MTERKQIANYNAGTSAFRIFVNMYVEQWYLLLQTD